MIWDKFEDTTVKILKASFEGVIEEIESGNCDSASFNCYKNTINDILSSLRCRAFDLLEKEAESRKDNDDH